MKKQIKTALIGILFVISSLSSSFADETSKPKDIEFAEWLYPVATMSAATQEINSLADEIKNTLGVKLNTLKNSKANPGCCLWIEITSWNSTNKPSYLIIISRDGGAIYANSLEGLRDAAEILKKNTKTKDGKVLAPIGIMTNFSIVDMIK